MGINAISFGGKTSISTYWKAGKLPEVTKGLYGGILTIENCSKEHVLPKSKGGKTVISNLALATKLNNNSRSNAPLSDWLTKDMFDEYAKQFEKVHLPDLDGPSYIKQLAKTIINIFSMEGKTFK